MAREQSRTAVCVIRAEHRDDGLLVTLMSTPDVEDTSRERLARARDVEAALTLVRRFLTEFVQEEVP